MENGKVILEARDVSCSKEPGAGASGRLRGVSLSIYEKTLNLLSGDEKSGSGLLLRLLGLLELPDEGEIFFNGAGTVALTGEVRAEIRNQRYGFLFAQPYLLPSFSVIENVAMPLFKISGVDAREAQRRTEAMLEFAGMTDFGYAPVGGLTFVQQQRVSLARALVNQPGVLIVESADAGFSSEEMASFVEDIRRAVSQLGTTAILAIRERECEGLDGRVIELGNGAICRDTQTALKKGGAKV